MNYHSDQWIMDRVQEHYNEALESFPKDRIVGIFYQGSGNYGLDYEDSDVDTKLIVTPTFKDIAMNKNPVSTTHIRANDENADAKEHIDGLKHDLYNYLPEIVGHGWFDVVSFDNLAIKQLNPQRIMSKETWDEMYMGDDGLDGEMTSASMYVDMVKHEFAHNSCAVDRYPIMDDIKDMFNFLRGRNGLD